MSKTSLTLLKKFLSENNIALSVPKYIPNLDKNISNTIISLEPSIIPSIIVDAYKGNSPLVKSISKYITSNYNIFLGRKEKLILKEALDYNKPNLLSSLYPSINFISLLNSYNVRIAINTENSVSLFLQNLTNAINSSDEKRIKDYIIFLYSRLVSKNESSLASLNSIWQCNTKFLKEELSLKDYNSFKQFCSSKTLSPLASCVKEYNSEYLRILSGTDIPTDVVALNINQSLYDSFSSKDDFYSYLFQIVKDSYSSLNNHRSFVLKVCNILSDNINIKWEVYSFITIFSESFNPVKVNKSFYTPSIICLDFLEHKYSISNSLDNKKILDDYFNGNISASIVSKTLNISTNSNELDFFSNINNGFHFIDCFVLNSETSYQNSKEIEFIKNQTELLLVFSKHAFDERKLPCPNCASLKVSGNSYSEVGVKSWECKNTLCSGRSKTNRGKRYSFRSIDMQNGVFKSNPNNIISKEMISKWRKDVVLDYSNDDLLQMVIKYFSFDGSKVSFTGFGSSVPKSLKKLSKSRVIIFEDYKIDKYDSNLFSKFYNSELTRKFIYKKETQLLPVNTTKEDYIIKNLNCNDYLNSFLSPSVHHMVTSPPYYNAREYSTWKNLYNYLNDMYNITLGSYSAMLPGGVFFYNIGDIFDNPHTIVKSKMGERRVALGAYMIFTFIKAGFVLLDNIIWYKGETQSNRHKNDGNYTPYYQKPANCYEHMFVFKKPGKLLVSDNPTITSNVLKFSPVIKINSKGVNTFGHTAPFPPILPQLSIDTFTKPNHVVLDPFLGSGTSIYTAVKLNRKAIGLELDDVYFSLCKSNIANELLKLF